MLTKQYLYDKIENVKVIFISFEINFHFSEKIVKNRIKSENNFQNQV